MDIIEALILFGTCVAIGFAAVSVMFLASRKTR